MPTSVMPKGVEHFGNDPTKTLYAVMPTSVMPKGVEHRQTAHAAAGATACPPL